MQTCIKNYAPVAKEGRQYINFKVKKINYVSHLNENYGTDLGRWGNNL